jgi:ribonuclease VapC
VDVQGARALHDPPAGADGIASRGGDGDHQLCYPIFPHPAGSIPGIDRRVSLNEDWFDSPSLRRERPAEMILDTSAMVAILNREPEADDFVRLIHDAEVCRISVASYVELSMVIENQLGPEGMRQTETFFRRAGVMIEPVTVDHGEDARQAFLDFRKGRHKAGLDFGDCFSYALAKATGEPLLFKGTDFRLTDIKAAWRTPVA